MSVELLRLDNISESNGARHRSKVVGRGIGSGRGKTSGRGGKGQTARSGVRLGGFEGGQTPIYRRMPKRGFNNPFSKPVYELDFKKISQILKKGLLPKDGTIDRDFLIKIGYVPKYVKNITLLGNGSLDQAVSIKVSKVTSGAKKIIEKTGCRVIEEKKTVKENNK